MTERKIQDYLAYYLGCECDFFIRLPEGFTGIGDRTRIDTRVLHNVFCDLATCKPILRPLSDLNISDIEKLDTAVFGIEGDLETALTEYKEMLLKPWPTHTRPAFPIYVKTINELRRLGFDCDELIESGLAINKSTIQK